MIDPKVMSLVFGAAGAGFLVFGWTRHRMIQLITDTPTSSVKDLAPGLRELRGTVKRGDKHLTSPLSEAKCAYFHFKVEEERTHTKDKGTSSSHWHTIVNDEQRVPFVLDDGTGEVEIDMRGAYLDFKTDTSSQSGFLDDATPSERAALKRYNTSSEGWFMNRKLRYTETVLRQGDSVYVLGQAVAGGDGYRITAGGPAFVVSDKGEEGAITGLQWTRGACAAGGLAFLVLALLTVLR
jgi:hypothetical protein